MLDKWEVVIIDITWNKIEKADKFLEEGWEPFAGTSGSGFDLLWLKRNVKNKNDKLKENNA